MAIYPLDQRRSSSSPLTTPSHGRRSATCALRRSSLPEVRAPPQAAPRTLEASWPCPTAGTPRARPDAPPLWRANCFYGRNAFSHTEITL
jgi:hypothetical protein